MRLQLIEQIQKYPPFAGEGAGMIGMLVDRARWVDAEKQRIIVRRGDHRDVIFFVVEGRLEQWLVGDEGSVTTTDIFYPGSWVSWLQLFRERASPRDLVAPGNTRLLEIDGAVIRGLLADNSHLYPRIINIISQRMDGLMLFQDTISITNRTHRLAGVLLLLANTDRVGNRINISHSRLARMLVCSRTTLHRCLQSLKQMECIRLGYGYIEIVDRPRLLDLSMFHPAK